MATFAELLEFVYEQTNRRDLVALTKQAVQAATLKLHNSDYYPKDLREESLILSAPANFVQLEYRSLFPRYRALSYLRATDATYTDDGVKYTILTPGEVLDSYSVNREDVCYLSGELLQLRSRNAVQHLLIGIYQHPDITESGYNSWIATEYPFAIVFEAAAKVSKTIGHAERAQQLERDALEYAVEMRNSNVLAVGS